MRHCQECAVDIEGGWSHCPLCGTTVHGEVVASPLADVALTYSRRRVLKVLFLTSVVIILGSFAAQLLFNRDPSGLGVGRSVWLGVSAMWLVVVMAIRKRHNIAKSTVWLVVLVGLVCVYWDYLSGWRGWSVSYAVPILCAASLVALLITVNLMRIEADEHLVYSGLTIVLGLVPILFLALRWVTTPIPSLICGALSVIALVLLQTVRGADLRHELARRLHL